MYTADVDVNGQRVRELRRDQVLTLSLRFNHEEFCDGLYIHRKTSEENVFDGLRRSS